MDEAKPRNLGGLLPVPNVAGPRRLACQAARPQPNTAVDLRLGAPAGQGQEEQAPVIVDLAGPRKRKRIKLGLVDGICHRHHPTRVQTAEARGREDGSDRRRRWISQMRLSSSIGEADTAGELLRQRAISSLMLIGNRDDGQG